jgi:hypothetical protein
LRFIRVLEIAPLAIFLQLIWLLFRHAKPFDVLSGSLNFHQATNPHQRRILAA